jgi:hypothetical protein
MEDNLPTFLHISLAFLAGAVAFAAQSRCLITTILLVSLVHQRRPGRLDTFLVSRATCRAPIFTGLTARGIMRDKRRRLMADWAAYCKSPPVVGREG